MEGAPFPVRVVVLFTSMTSDKLIRVNQERLEQLFYVKNVPTTTFDASESANKALREALFAVSGLKAVYPQVFVEREPGVYDFVGDYKAVHTINEHDDITGAFDRAFAVLPAYAATLSPDRLAWLATRTAEVEALHKKWEQLTSSGGEAYWFCRGTGESSWVDPRAAIGPGSSWIPQTEQGSGRRYFYNFKTGKSAWKLPS